MCFFFVLSFIGQFVFFFCGYGMMACACTRIRCARSLIRDQIHKSLSSARHLNFSPKTWSFPFLCLSVLIHLLFRFFWPLDLFKFNSRNVMSHKFNFGQNVNTTVAVNSPHNLRSWKCNVNSAQMCGDSQSALSNDSWPSFQDMWRHLLQTFISVKRTVMGEHARCF